MKNLFKNLMLVAVAAMAFTACTENNEEVNATKKDTVLKFATSFADTRVTIADETNEAGEYPVTWDGNEDVLFDVQDGGMWTGLKSNMTVDADKRNASFEVILSGGAEGASADEGSTIYGYFGKFDLFRNLTVAGETQTPTVNGVDKSFISMVAEFPVEVEGQMEFVGTFNHKTAYGLITLPASVDGVAFKTLTIKVNNAKEYILNVDGLDTHSYWFACEPDTVTSIYVSAVDSESTVYGYTASDLNKTFVAGTVSKFSIKSLEAGAAEPEPSVKTFTSAEVVTAYGLNDYEICFKDQDGKEFYVEFYYANDDDHVVENDILKEGTYLLDDNGTSNGLYYVDYDGLGYNGATVVVSHVDGLYNIQFTDLWKWDYSAGEKTTVPFEEAVYTGAITGLSTPAGTTPEPEPDPTPEPGTPEGTGTQSDPYVYACNVEYQSLFGGYYTLTFTCETEGSFNLYFETMNANLNNFTSSSLSDSSKFCSSQITGYAKSWTPEESTVTIKNIAVKTYSVDIKISTFDGYVYYTCPSVVFP